MKKFKLAVLALIMVSAIMPVKAQKWGSPEDSAQCVRSYAIYRQLYKIKDYDGCYDDWKFCLTHSPKCSENLYIQGANILKHKINKAANAEERQARINELMEMYDIRIANFGKPEQNLCRKAFDLMKLVGDKGVDQYYPIYAEAIRVGGEQVEASHVYLYFQSTIKYVQAGHADGSLVVDNYDIASDLLEKELMEAAEAYEASKAEGDTAKISKDSARVDMIRKQLGSVENDFAPYADCDQLVNIYSKKFEANPNDLNLLKKITKIMRKKKCTKSALFFDATEKLYAIEPSPATALMMGQMCYSKDKFSDAVKYLKDAIAGLDDKKDIYAAYILLGLSYGETNSYSAARSAYYEAAKVDPSKGEPYLQIAGLYAKGHRSVDDGMGGLSAYWAAYDKANRAKSVDPTIADKADEMMGRYRSAFPKQVDAFMLNLVDGAGFTVPGWIGEGTVVRTRK